MIWPWKHNSNTSNVHEIMLYYTRTPESAFRGFYNLELFIIGLINFQIVFISVSSFIGEGDGTPLQSSCLENPMDGGAWWAAVSEVVESRTQLSDFTFTFHFHALEKKMATHSSTLAWKIPWTAW